MPYVEALTGTDIELGRVVRDSLRASSAFPFQGIFWLSDSDSGIWHLFIATSRVDTAGPRNAYAELGSVIGKTSTVPGQFLRIKLISPKDPLYQALRSVFAERAFVDGTRLGNTQIEGLFIDDAYLYEIH